MTWVGPIESKEFNSAVAAATYTWTTFGANIPIGTLILIGWACEFSTTPSTCADNSAQAGTANSYTIRSSVTATGLKGGTIWCVTTRQIQTTDTITLTLVSSSPTRRSGRLLTFTGQGINPFDVAVVATAVTVSPLVIGPSAALAGTDELSVGFGFWKGGAVLSGVADATTGYTLVASSGSGGTTPRVETNISYKKTAGTAAETDTQSYTSITSAVGELLTFQPVPAPKQIHLVRRTWAGR